MDDLEKLEDPIAALMTLHAEQDGRLIRSLSKTRWEAFINPQELFDTRWLLVYEGVGQGWLKPASGDPAPSDPFFADARAKGISFYNPSVARTIPEPSAPGVYA